MSDFTRLHALLAKLGGRDRAPGEGRKLKGAAPQDLLAALVTEIDETILPRRLSLTTPKGVVHLAVANRRLQALLAPLPDLDGAAELGDRPLPDTEDPLVPALKTLLLQAFEGAAALEVSARRLDRTFGSDIGVPANLLGRAWAVADLAPQKELPPEEMVTAFLKGLDTAPITWLRIRGEEVTDQRGTAEEAEALGARAAVFLDGYFAKFEELFPPQARACGTLVGAAGAAMLFVEVGEESAFLSGPEVALQGALAQWQSYVAE